MHYNDDHKNDNLQVDDTKMPETFDEFKSFILSRSLYNFWARCEYEVIITGWPQQKRERKIDVYDQIKHNIDVVTKVFMDNVLKK